MTTTIFVPQPLPPRATDRLAGLGDVATFPHLDRRITKSELLEAVADREILYAMGEVPYDRDVIEAARPLRFVAAMHSKATFVDQQAATERGVPVSGNAGMTTRTAAELTFALLMATMRRIPQADRFLREGRWQQNQSVAFMGSRLYGKTLGIVGLGKIGREVAKRARASDMDVIYTKRTRLPADDEARLGVEYRDIEDLFREADAITLNPALTAQTTGLVGEGLLRLMKPTAFLVNTSRGDVLDEAALEDALREGRIAGAGLDVYEREIPERDPGPRPGLLELPNVVLTPHIGSAARETREEMAAATIDAIEAFLAGERPEIVLNPEVYGEAARDDEVIG